MRDLVIDGISIDPGEHRILALSIARLPSGTEIDMPIHIYRSQHDGPTLLLSGGMHGDEVNGIEIVRKFLESGLAKKLRRGSIVAVPIINVYGFINFSRDVPDGKDVNRSFPGNPEGSLASRVAYTLTRKILPEIDFGLDFHTGGASRTNFPQIRFQENDALGAEIAEAFAAPFTLYSNVIDGSLRATAQDMGKCIVVFEGGETLRIDSKTVSEGVDGIRRTLKHFHMIDKAPRQMHKRQFFARSSWLRADVSGLFRHKVGSGKAVHPGQTLGYISSPTNEYSERLTSPYRGYIIGHNNFPLIHRGDALFHVGLLEDS